MTCAVSDCTRPHYAKTFCSMHWKRNHRNGDPVVLGYVPKGSCTIADMTRCAFPATRHST